MFLLERLESQIATGTGVPRTRKVLVDKDAVLDLIDQLRVAVPEEVHAAKRINAEGERIIEKANEEAGADRGARPGAGGLPDRRAGPDRGGRGRGPADHRRGPARRGRRRLGADDTPPRSWRGSRPRCARRSPGSRRGSTSSTCAGRSSAATTRRPSAPTSGRRRDGSAMTTTTLPRTADWPTAVDDAVLLREEDAGQTVSR